MNHEVIIDGKIYVPKEAPSETDGLGLFRVTVERVWYNSHPSMGVHQLEVVAGSWVKALKLTASCTNDFTYEQREQT